MKWCFLVNNAQWLSEFLGEVGREALKQGDECMVVINSKIAEYEKRKLFPQGVRVVSRVDWCLSNWKGVQDKDFKDLSWHEFAPALERFSRLKWSYAFSLQVVSQFSQFFNHLIATEKPDVFVGEPPAGIFGKMASHAANSHHIPFLGLVDSRVKGDYIDVYDKEYTNSKLRSAFAELSEASITEEEKQLANEYLEQFLSAAPPSSMKDQKLRFSQKDLVLHYAKKMRKEGRVLWRYARSRSRFKSVDYESESILKHSISSPLACFLNNFSPFLPPRRSQKTRRLSFHSLP